MDSNEIEKKILENCIEEIRSSINAHMTFLEKNGLTHVQQKTMIFVVAAILGCIKDAFSFNDDEFAKFYVRSLEIMTAIECEIDQEKKNQL